MNCAELWVALSYASVIMKITISSIVIDLKIPIFRESTRQVVIGQFNKPITFNVQINKSQPWFQSP